MSLYLIAIVVFAGLVAATASLLPPAKALRLAGGAALTGVALIVAILIVNGVLPRSHVDGCANPHAAAAYLQLALALLALAVTAFSMGAAIRAAGRHKGAVVLVLAEVAATVAILVALFWPWLCGS